MSINTSSRKPVRPIAVGHLRSFEAVARHLNFRAAAQELALTQPAITRQIQNLETNLGAVLFERSTRTVTLTPAGKHLLQAVTNALTGIDGAVRNIRAGLTRQAVSITTFASFASSWLIPKMQLFQQQIPDIDIRVDATDTFVDIENQEVDLALRYGRYEQMPKGAMRLFEDEVCLLASPWLLKSAPPLRSLADIGRFTLIDMSVSSAQQAEWLTWDGWLRQHHFQAHSPQRWLRFDYAYQAVQAALAGQGLVLARLPMVQESVRSGDLIEPLPQLRLRSPMAYWLLTRTGSLQRREVLAFSNWLQKQALLTRKAMKQVSLQNARNVD